jgi:type II secretory ATPase GspE/PulE/Tfp pilus assembly ATPase PilB-like protein
MNDAFVWPSPPYHELVDPPHANVAGIDGFAAVVTFADGSWQAGSLLQMNADNATIQFLPKRGKQPISFEFDELKCIRLVDPIRLSQPRLEGQSALAADDGVGTQKCTVRFKEGMPMVGVTTGYIVEPFGLFLFLLTASDNVLRWFVPTGAMANFQIGDHLGKILIDKEIVSEQSIAEGLKIQQELRSKKLGDYLKQQNIVTQAQLEEVLRQQKAMPQLRLGEALLEEQLITNEQLAHALKLQVLDRKIPLGDILVEMKVVTPDTIKRVLAQKLGIPFVNLRNFNFGTIPPNLIHSDLIKKHSAMPLYCTETRLVVALENPLATAILQELSISTNLKVDPVMASAEDLAYVIAKIYGGSSRGGNIAELVSELGTGTNLATFDLPVEAAITESDNLLVRLVNKIIMDASDQRVSDIHIESMKGTQPTRVRFRKDGVLTTYSEIPANFRNALISRLKVMSRLNISEKRHSQDGKINFEQFGPAKIELRVLTMPTTEGLEDIVMRILTVPKAVSIDNLDLSTYGLERIKKIAHRPHGLIFVCGPTGSGKTTTLHAVLAFINTPERKIWTVEDPIEITQEGLRQVQVQSRIDWTFAAVLRSFMRADPDIIMVGETRDAETAKTVIEASLTGHLVLSTLHTNSAAESVVRLLDFGLDPFNFADALLGVVGQRLARRLCTYCRQVRAASDEELDRLLYEYCFETKLDSSSVKDIWLKQYGNKDGNLALYHSDGCDHCNRSGYRGRVGIHEVLVSTPAIRKHILEHATVSEMLSTALAEGMRTIKQDGIEKILQGDTDWEQIKAF